MLACGIESVGLLGKGEAAGEQEAEGFASWGHRGGTQALVVVAGVGFYDFRVQKPFDGCNPVRAGNSVEEVQHLPLVVENFAQSERFEKEGEHVEMPVVCGGGAGGEDGLQMLQRVVRSKHFLNCREASLLGKILEARVVDFRASHSTGLNSSRRLVDSRNTRPSSRNTRPSSRNTRLGDSRNTRLSSSNTGLFGNARNDLSTAPKGNFLGQRTS